MRPIPEKMMANLERQTQEASTRYRNLRHEQFISAESLRKDPQSAGKSLWANDALLEDVARRQGQTQQPGDWADAQVTKQLMGMGVDRYEVGILKDKRMTLTEMDTNRVIYESSNLRKLNLGGAEIHIRPKETSGYSLSLVDDVSLETMGRSGSADSYAGLKSKVAKLRRLHDSTGGSKGRRAWQGHVGRFHANRID